MNRSNVSAACFSLAATMAFCGIVTLYKMNITAFAVTLIVGCLSSLVGLSFNEEQS